jgi:hypothetical protein
MTNGGTATDPNGVPSLSRRSGGRPGAPATTHSSRRRTRYASVGSERTSTGSDATTPTHEGRCRIATRASGSMAVVVITAAMARRLMPWFSADAVAAA